MSTDELRAQAADALGGLGAFTQPWMRTAFLQVPRHQFVPDQVWIGGGYEYRPLHRGDDPQQWARQVYEPDEPTVTQVDDGQAESFGRLPTSSISAPTAVFHMLAALDLEPGMRVLEIGTGTGWNAALLAHRTGDTNVTSIEVDPVLAEQAANALKVAGYGPTLVVGDGEQGWPAGAPYDRVLATCSVLYVPWAWIEQTRPGGVVVVPLSPTFHSHGLVHLAVAKDARSASGRFLDPVGFMTARAQRPVYRLTDMLTDQAWDETRDSAMDTDLSDLTDWRARFALAAGLPGVFHQQDGERWWFSSSDSWAMIESGQARQWGPRSLVDEVVAGLEAWRKADEPSWTDFGLTVTREGQRVWLHDPGHPWAF